MKRSLKMTLGLISLLSLSACFPAVLGGAAVVGTTVAQERSAGDRLDDNIIALKIHDQLAQADVGEMFARVSVTVHEGRVLLTGSVKTEAYAKEAATLAWKIEGVKEVINEAEVSSRTIGSVTKDSIIANSIRSKLLVDGDVKSMNYKVEVNNEIVYLIGVAKDRKELNKVIDVARNVSGVKRVVNHVVLASDHRRHKNEHKEKE